MFPIISKKSKKARNNFTFYARDPTNTQYSQNVAQQYQSSSANDIIS
jgi:hypothetical protein